MFVQRNSVIEPVEMAAPIAENRDEFGYRIPDAGWTEKYEHLDTDDELPTLSSGRNSNYSDLHTWEQWEHVDTDDEMFFPSEEAYRRKNQVRTEQRSISACEPQQVPGSELQTMTDESAGDRPLGREDRATGVTRDHSDTAISRWSWASPGVRDRLVQTNIRLSHTLPVRDLPMLWDLTRLNFSTSISRSQRHSRSIHATGNANNAEFDPESEYSDGTFSDWESDSDDSDDDLLENLATIELSVDCPIVEDGETVTCSICLDECPGAEGSARVVAKCGHKFHAECLETWLKRHDQCPNCRCNVSHQRSAVIC
jgi:hypothetical protein